MTIYSSQRTTLKDIVKDPWVNIGQEEELKPYSELSWGGIDPQVMEIMKNFEFKQHKIQESLIWRKYNNIIGIIWSCTQQKQDERPGHTVTVRSCPSWAQQQSFHNSRGSR